MNYRTYAIITFVIGILITGCAQIEKPVIVYSNTTTTKIMNGSGTYEAKVFSREPCLLIQIEATSNTPLPEIGNNEDLVHQITLINTSSGKIIVRDLLPNGGGGGGGPPFNLEQEFRYEEESPIALRQVTILATFNKAIGFTIPVRFDVDVILRPTLFCSKLPPTTPEG
jgi:hypothetical protein